MSKDILSDVDEAVSLMETYKLSSLVWRFEECPIVELKHYIPQGREQFVVLCHRDDKFIPFRMIDTESMGKYDFIETYITQLSFNSEFHLFIISNTSKVI